MCTCKNTVAALANSLAIIAAEHELTKQKQRDKARNNKEAALAKKTKRFDMPLSDVLEKPIYVSTNIALSQSDNLEAKLAPFNKVPYIMDAHVVVSSTLVLDKMGDKLACVVMLCGMIVVRPGFIFGNEKACLTCNPAIKRRRRLFLSAGFRTKYAGLVNIIMDAARKPTSTWKVMETLEEYNDCCSKASVQNKAQHTVVTRRGEDVPGIVVGGKQLTKEELMRSIQIVDVFRTRGSV